MYLDTKGLITQSNGDGGDKLQREGFWYEGSNYNTSLLQPPGMASYPKALIILTDSEGNLLRDEVQYTNPTDVSRDQLVSNIRACPLYGQSSVLQRIFANVIKNISQYPNGDLAFLIDYARFIRSFGLWYLFPVLLILDIQLFLTAIYNVLISYPDKNGWFWAANTYVGNDLNFIGDLQQAKKHLSTPLSFLARKIFKLRAGGAMYGMEVYFNANTGANPEFIELWKPIVKDF